MKEIVKTQRTVIQNIPQEDFQSEEDEILRFAAQQISTNIFPNEVGIEERRTFARVSEGEDLHVYMKDNIITLAEGVDIILGEDVADEHAHGGAFRDAQLQVGGRLQRGKERAPAFERGMPRRLL